MLQSGFDFFFTYCPINNFPLLLHQFFIVASGDHNSENVHVRSARQHERKHQAGGRHPDRQLVLVRAAGGPGGARGHGHHVQVRRSAQGARARGAQGAGDAGRPAAQLVLVPLQLLVQQQSDRAAAQTLPIARDDPAALGRAPKTPRRTHGLVHRHCE